MSSITRRWDCAVARKYESKQTGEQKTQWVNVGRAVEWDGENIEVELNTMPVFPGWNGRIKLFVPRDKADAKPAPRATAPKSHDAFDDEIPF